MPTAFEFRQEQRGVARAMAAAFATTIVVLGVVLLAGPAAAPTPFVERLQSTVRADLVVIAWVAAAIANVARLRFVSKQDIVGSHAGPVSDRVGTAGAILQNTLEQAVLAIMTHLVVAATYDRSGPVVATLVCLFTIGRVLFSVGYRHGARARAFGFALTFYPSVLALTASAAMILLGRAA